MTTYGDLCPEAPRFAGMVMSACDDPDVPWHRIVRADGSLAKGRRQRKLLDAEGVPFRGSRVDMRVAWADVASLADPRRVPVPGGGSGVSSESAPGNRDSIHSTQDLRST